jgi:hypothetical protein
MRDRLKPGFTYKFELFGRDGELKWSHEQENLIPDAGRDYIINAAVNGGAQVSTWYVGLFEANRTPAANDTMTLFLADASETADYTTTGNARLTITPDALAAGVWANVGTPCEFTFTTAATLHGSFITSGATRASTAGLLLSAVKWPSAKTAAIGDVLRVTVGFSMIPV